ncbi:MAG: hypothetical protein CMJ78_04770 [Planctomycetaceae bacterium]|nr:hypothetical protein [Planctomycetaceae bacterium]
MSILKVESGRQKGSFVRLRDDNTLFGRHPNCHIVLNSTSVSRHHAQIVFENDSVFLEDLKSQNGTYLNGDRIEKRIKLNDGDEVNICDNFFTFYFQLPPESPADDLGATHSFGDSSDGFVVGEVCSEDQGLRGTNEFNSEPHEIGIADELVFEPSDYEDSDSSGIIARRESMESSVRTGRVHPETLLDAVLQISNNLRRVLDLDGVLNEIMNGLFNIFQHANEGFVLLRDDDEPEKLVVRATHNRDVNASGKLPISMTIVRLVLETGDTILSADAGADSRFLPSQSLGKLRTRSILCAPLISKAGEPLGIIQLATASGSTPFREEDLDLIVSIATQGSLAIENARLHQEALKQSQLAKELEFATQVQRGFLPSKPPTMDGYQFHHFYQSSNTVGGDYFDYIDLPGGRIAMSLADIAGKGVPAALLMAMFYSSARYHLLTNDSLSGAIADLNRECCGTTSLGHRFITCIMLVVDPSSHQVTVVNAGHLAPIRRSSNGSTELIGEPEAGMPLGILADQEFVEVTFTSDPGDSLLLYSDGITEAQNSDKEHYSSSRLREFVANDSNPIDELVPAIIADVASFVEKSAFADDVCVMACRHIKA